MAKLYASQLDLNISRRNSFHCLNRHDDFTLLKMLSKVQKFTQFGGKLLKVVV